MKRIVAIVINIDGEASLYWQSVYK